MIERLGELINSFHQHFNQYLNWYQGADPLTQYAVLAVSGGCFLLLSFVVIFSKITK